MKIFDCFTFFDEIDVLKMRLELHYEYVDKFYISESDYTHRGKWKGYLLQEGMPQLKRWEDKIVHVKHSADIKGLDFSLKDNSTNYNSPAWVIENSQRNALSVALQEMADDDLAIISDLDEFINPQFFQLIVEPQTFDIARLHLINHYYYMNCQVTEGQRDWFMPMLIKGRLWRETEDISRMRPNAHIETCFSHAGWHFSYLGGIERIQNKISSMAHSEYDTPEINNPEHLTESIKNGVDYITGKSKFGFFPIQSYPDCIQKLMLKNRNFVKWTLY